MPVAYADLVVREVTAPATAFSGRALSATWVVANQGIGTTSKGDWVDYVYLARNPDGSDRLAGAVPFQHFGHLAVDGTYTRTGEILLPDGSEGTFYVVVTGGPFEFIHTDNN